jgi:hypothetical protein
MATALKVSKQSAKAKKMRARARSLTRLLLIGGVALLLRGRHCCLLSKETAIQFTRRSRW